jgi:Pentapeptide repeats (8 copies)
MRRFAVPVAAAVVLLVVLAAFVLVAPRRLYPPLSAAKLQDVTSAEKRVELQQAQAKLENDARATLLQGLAGLLLVAGAVATWRQVRISQEGQITERFSRAVDHLGSDKLDIRMGGIYALERIAMNSPADRRTVLRVLEAFARTHAPWLVGSPDGPQHPTLMVDEQLPWLQHRAPDVQTAVRVIGRHPFPPSDGRIFLSRIDLRAAYLANIRLPNALIRHANLARAWMAGAQLQDSDLEDTDLRQTMLEAARLTGASLRNAHLQNADLGGADLRGADLRGANLNEARLQGANLTGARTDTTTVWPADFDPQGSHLVVKPVKDPGTSSATNSR